PVCCASADAQRARSMALSARTVIFLFMCFSLPPSPCHSTLDTCLFSFDHFIRSCQHVRRNRQADLLGSFQIDDQLKLCWLFHWHFSWLCTSQDFIHVDRGPPPQIGEVRTIGHHASSLNIHITRVYRRQSALQRHACDRHSVVVHKGVRKDIERSYLALRHRRKRSL